MVTHDPRAAAYAHRVLFLADGLLVGELRSPTQASVLEMLGSMGAAPAGVVAAPAPVATLARVGA